MPVCRYCNEEKKLVRAHVIPEAFFRLLRSHDQVPLMVNSGKGAFPQRRPIGEYDEGILCGECESLFGPLDSYAADLLIKELPAFSAVVVDGELELFRRPEYDYDKLKLFLVSVLWRASVSGQPFYRRVSLGPWEGRAKQFLECGHGGGENDFSTFFSALVRDNSRMLVGGTILNPMPEKWDGVRAYRVYLGGIIAHVKVDQLPYRDPFLSLMARRNEQLDVLARDLGSSPDLRAMRKAAAGLKRK